MERVIKQFTIKTLSPEYVDKLVAAGADYFIEADWKKNNINCNSPGFRNLCLEYLDNPFVGVYLAIDDKDDVVGFSIIYCQNDYTVEMIGDMFLFAVRPDWRGTLVARSLAELSVALWKAWGVKRIYIECAPGLDDPQHLNLFKNLWGKLGFEPVGIVMKLDL